MLVPTAGGFLIGLSLKFVSQAVRRKASHKLSKPVRCAAVTSDWTAVSAPRPLAPRRLVLALRQAAKDP
jgi:hypothetical protein